MTPKLLTESEVAEILRCSTSKVKRLRLGGHLAYVPGRRVLISEDDLNAFLEARKRRPVPAEPAVEERPVVTPEEHARIREQVQRSWMRRHFGVKLR